MGLYNEIKPELYYFLTQLENYNEVPFNKTIKKHGFSVGFIFKELCEEFNLRIIPGIESCLAGGAKKTKGRTFKGLMTFLFKKGVRSGRRTFAEDYQEISVFSTSMIRDEIYRIMKRMEALEHDMHAMDKTTFNKNKSKHDKLGYLNATQWFKLGMYNTQMFKSLKETLDRGI